MCVGTRLSLSFSLLQESERYAYEWQRCLESALQVSVAPPPPPPPILPSSLQDLPHSVFETNRQRKCGNQPWELQFLNQKLPPPQLNTLH